MQKFASVIIIGGYRREYFAIVLCVIRYSLRQIVNSDTVMIDAHEKLILSS